MINRTLVTASARSIAADSFAMVCALFLIFAAFPASAAPETVGQMMMQVESQFSSASIMNIFALICYVIATMFGIQALMGAVNYATPNSNVKLNGLTWRVVGSAALYNTPQVVGLLRQVLFSSAKQSSTIQSEWGKTTGVTEGLDGSLVNMIADVQPALTTLIGTIAFLSGIIMIASGLLAMSNINYAQDNTSKKQIIARLGVGTALTAFATSVKTILMTLFDTSTANGVAALAYDSSALDAATSAQINGVLNAIFIWLALIGLIAILRGLWILKDLLEKGGGLTGPLTHLIAGGMLVNMGPTVRLIEKTLDVPGIT